MVLGRETSHLQGKNIWGMPEFLSRRQAVKQEHLRGDGEEFQVYRCFRKVKAPFSPVSSHLACFPAQDLEGTQLSILGPENRTEELIYVMCLELCLPQGECYILVCLLLCYYYSSQMIKQMDLDISFE